MKKTFTWLQISDIHFRPSKNHQYEGDSYDQVTSALIKFLKNLPEGVSKPEVVFATGDTAFSGKFEEYQRASSFFRKILSDNNISHSNFFVIPGNHDNDLDKNIPKPPDLLTKDLVEKILSDKEYGEKYYQQLHNYNSWCTRSDLTRGRCKFNSSEPYYVKKINVNGIEIGVVGLQTSINSGYVGIDNRDKDGYDQTQGKVVVGENIVRNALNSPLLKNVDFIFTLGHHPLHWYQQDIEEQTRNLIKTKSDFYLQGHTHREKFDRVFDRNDRWDTFFSITSGALHVGKNNLSATVIILGTIELEDQKNQYSLTIWPFNFNPDTETFVPDMSYWTNRKGFPLKFDNISNMNSKNIQSTNKVLNGQDEKNDYILNPFVMSTSNQAIDLAKKFIEDKDSIRALWGAHPYNSTLKKYFNKVSQGRSVQRLIGIHDIPQDLIADHVTLMSDYILNGKYRIYFTPFLYSDGLMTEDQVLILYHNERADTDEYLAIRTDEKNFVNYVNRNFESSVSVAKTNKIYLAKDNFSMDDDIDKRVGLIYKKLKELKSK